MAKQIKPQFKQVDLRIARPSQVQERIRGRRGIAVREAVKQDEPLCRHCKAAGRVTVATVIDHIVPLAKGGSNDKSNYQPLCVACHDAKTADDFKR